MAVINADFRCYELINAVYQERKVGVEIGVYRGALSWRLLSAMRGIFLYLVDPWAEAVDGDSYLTTDDEIAGMSQVDHDENLRVTLEKIAPFKGRYEVVRKTSLEFAKDFPLLSADFVFIDGDHSYEGCRADIEAWWPRVKAGGVLSGHDYRDERNYGVIRAVDEFVAANDLSGVFRLGANYTWFIDK